VARASGVFVGFVIQGVNSVAISLACEEAWESLRTFETFEFFGL
jgi:hypothetical protein